MDPKTQAIRDFIALHWLKVETVEDIRVLRAGKRLPLLDACLKWADHPHEMIAELANLVREHFLERLHEENSGTGWVNDRLTLTEFEHHPSTELKDVLGLLDRLK